MFITSCFKGFVHFILRRAAKDLHGFSRNQTLSAINKVAYIGPQNAGTHQSWRCATSQYLRAIIRAWHR